MVDSNRIIEFTYSLLLSSCLFIVLVSAAATNNNENLEDEFGTRMEPGTGTTVKKALGTESPPPVDDDFGAGLVPEFKIADGPKDVDDISHLLPKSDTLFNKDAIDPTVFQDMDCHMRNLDLCYAGLLGAGVKLLPENDLELEVRCDEMKAMMSCIQVYLHRCQTINIMSIIMPMGSLSQVKNMIPKEIQDTNVPLEMLGANDTKRVQIKAIDLLDLCEPSAKGTKANRELRQKLYQLAKCVTPKISSLKPCLEDLKTAFQLFYEPGRFLPLEPSCCAVSRFRACARQTLDNICGISSFQQIEASLNSGAGGGIMKTLERACQRRASSYETDYCKEVLPARGIKVPINRGGRKASKLARVLDMLSFAP